MKSPYVLAFMAVSIGLVCAAAALYILKPQDAPLTLPGSAQIAQDSNSLRGLPAMIIIGEKTAAERVDVVLNGVDEANKEAYAAAVSLRDNNPQLTINIIPAVTPDNKAYTAFAWAMVAQNADFMNALMGSSGDISPQVLTLLAQNSGLDADALRKQAAEDIVTQALSQANNVIPPTLPALYVNNQWLTGDAIKSAAVPATTPSEARVLVSDAYAYATAPSAKTAAVFLTLKNMGASPADITGVSTSVAGRAEIHTMTHENGVMQMRKLPNLTIQPQETVTLDPMGLHVMLFDLPAPLAVGQKFPLTLVLQGGSELSTFVTVTAPGQTLTNHAH